MMSGNVFSGGSFPSKEKPRNRFATRPLVAAALVGAGLAAFGVGDASGATERRLAFYMVHTKETIDVVYKRNGRYVPSALRKLNWFMRDWRRDIPTRMDPAVLDLVWEMRTELGSKVPTHVISGYRSVQTNDMLRRIGRRVAHRSQHTRGKAIDLAFPDVPLIRLRNSALVKQRGGVGFYPRSGASGFVHVDTGRVRHWPRISDARLASIFREHDPNAKVLWARAERPERKRIRSGPLWIVAAPSAPTPKSKPHALIAALKAERVRIAALSARRTAEQTALQRRIELLNREDLQIHPAAAARPQSTNFAAKNDYGSDLRGSRLEDSPFSISALSAAIASMAPTPDDKGGFWGLMKIFDFFPLSLFRRDGQPQRFQIDAPDPERPATGDARTVVVEVAALDAPPDAPGEGLRDTLSPEQLARVASQVVNRSDKTSLIRTPAVETVRPTGPTGPDAVEAKPLDFE